MQRNLNEVEISNSELIFWNVETNKCFIISNTDGSAGCLQVGQNNNYLHNEEIKSKSSENDLSKNIGEMRKILETDNVGLIDDVEEEMKKMFDENNTTSMMEDALMLDSLDHVQEDTQIKDDCTSFQLEEFHYEHIIEIASEPLVESGQIDARTLCSEKSETVCKIVSNNEFDNTDHDSTLLEDYRTENVENMITDSINEKRQMLQEIRKRISKIHIHLNKKRKYYESVPAKVINTNLQNCSETSSHSSADQQKCVLNRMNFKRNRKRKHQPSNILSHWRSKFEKEIRNNMNQLMTVPNKSLKARKPMNIYTKQCPIRAKVIMKTFPKNKSQCNTRQNGSQLKTFVKRKSNLEIDMPIIEEVKEQELWLENHKKNMDALKIQCLSKSSPNSSLSNHPVEIGINANSGDAKPMTTFAKIAISEQTLNDVVFFRLRKITHSTTCTFGNNKVYNHFIGNIDKSAYNLSDSFNLDTINYTFRWLQYILSKKLHKAEMETELEKLKFHYYRLFHLNLIGCCAKSSIRIRKHSECSDRLNRIVFCSLMDTYVIRIVKYIILAFQNNLRNVVNSTEIIARFLSFFIDRSKLLYFLFLYKSKFLLNEHTAIDDKIHPKSMSFLARICLLKMICKNPKQHDCMENMEQLKQPKECTETVDILKDYDPVKKMPGPLPPKKNFNSDYSIEKLLQKPRDIPVNLVMNKNENCNYNLNRQQTKRLINYRRQTIASECFESKVDLDEVGKDSIPPEIQVNSSVEKSNTLHKTFVAVGNTSYELATMPDFVRGACQVINQRYPNITINPTFKPSKIHHKRSQIEETRNNNGSTHTEETYNPFLYSNAKIWELLSSQYQFGKICSSNEKREKCYKRNQNKYQKRQLFHGNKDQCQERINHSNSTTFDDRRIKVISSIVLPPTEKSDHSKTVETILISDDSDAENLTFVDNATTKNQVQDPQKIEFLFGSTATDNDRRRNEVLYEERRHYKFSQNYITKHNLFLHKKEKASKANEENQSKKSILLGKYKESAHS